MRNILTEWKKEADIMSSGILINTPFYNDDIDRIYNTLVEYFKLEYFEITPESKSNWLYFLLATPKSKSCIINLFEIVKIIEKIKTFPKSRRRKIRTILHEPNQLREAFFEVYIQLVFEFNKYSVSSNKSDKGKPLDLVLYDNGNEYLIECTKLYMPHNERMLVLFNVLSKVMEIINSSNRNVVAIQSVVTIRVYEYNSENLIKSVEVLYFDLLSAIVRKDFIRGTLILKSPEAELQIDTSSEVFEEYYSEKFYQPFVKFCFTHNKEFNRVIIETKIHNNVSNENIFLKTRRVILDKIIQHRAANYKNKILVIDCETIPELDQAAYRDSVSYKKDDIETILKEVATDESVAIIMRDYSGERPAIRLSQFATSNTKELLFKWRDTLNFAFAFKYVFDVVQNCKKYKLRD